MSPRRGEQDSGTPALLSAAAWILQPAVLVCHDERTGICSIHMKKNVHDEKTVRAKENAKQRQIDKTGLTSRVRGHVSAAGKRHQGKKDAR